MSAPAFQTYLDALRRTPPDQKTEHSDRTDWKFCYLSTEPLVVCERASRRIAKPASAAASRGEG